MDDESESSGTRSKSAQKKASKKQAEALPEEEANATVSEVFPNQCRVRLDVPGSPGSVDPLCSYRRSGVIGHSTVGKDLRERSPVAVGDRVKVALSGTSSGVVEGVCKRRNQLFRPAPGRDVQNIHVIAANLDQLVIVASVAEPEFSPGLVDRYLIAAGSAGIEPVICVTKVDLLKGKESPAQLYRDLGYLTFELCSKTGSGVSELADSIRDRTVAFCGHSGVGKTSLLRSLLSSDIGKVGDLSAATGKGRHTTTGAVLLEGPGSSRWIDTPGVREFGLMEVHPERLREFFPEFSRLPCAQDNCFHLDEEGCSARSLPRYASYRRIHQSLVAGEN